MNARVAYKHRPPSDQLAARRTAVRLVARGEPVAAVARHYGISRQAVYDWIKAPKEDPKHGFEPGKRGRPAQLTRAQRKRLARMLVQGPLVHGWETNLWTCKRIRQLIADTFGVIYHEASVSRLLRKTLRFSRQKPVRRAREPAPQKNRAVPPVGLSPDQEPGAA